MKLTQILTLATTLIVTFTTQASSSKFVQVLDCKLRTNKSSMSLNIPVSLGLKLTETGNNNKLIVNGLNSNFTNETLDEGMDNLTFQFGKEKIQAIFSYGQCETTGMGAVEAEVIPSISKVEFSGNPNLSYACRCAK